MFQLNTQLHGGVVDWLVDDVLGFGSGGGGGGSAPESAKVTVAPSTVAPTDVAGESGDSSTAKARRKKGFASTVSSNTLMGSAGDERNTLG